MRLIDADALTVRIAILQDDTAISVVLNDQVRTSPTIDPVVHARWIDADPTDANSVVYCSNPECNALAIDVGCYGVAMYRQTRYCYQCGAKMDAKNENSTTSNS